MNAIKQTRELPLFTISAKIEKDDKGLNEAEKLYVKLLDLFEMTPIKDDSYIGDLIMTFNEQFTKMTNNLLNSNIRFKEGVLPKKLKTDSIKFTESNKQYIISPKQLNINELPEKQWESNYVTSNKNIKTSYIDANQFLKQSFYVSNDNIIGMKNNLLQQEEKIRREEKERKKQKMI